MNKKIILSISVDEQFANRVSAVVDRWQDPYGKKNRAYILRELIEIGLEKIEKEYLSVSE
jgi:predicted DNA-binding protein